MRRIARATRWLTGLGLALTGGLAALFAAQARTNAVTPAVDTSPVTAAAGSDSTPLPTIAPPPVPQPITRIPARPHTSSGGS